MSAINNLLHNISDSLNIPKYEKLDEAKYIFGKNAVSMLARQKTTKINSYIRQMWEYQRQVLWHSIALMHR